MKNKQKSLDGIDELGLGVSLYFKLLKSLTFFFILLSVINIPIYYIYFYGDMRISSTTTWLSYLTIGNIGQTSEYCVQNNLQYYDLQMI